MTMTAYTLFSGSGGNCVFVSDGNDSVLIDAGKSAKQVTVSLNKIGSDISKIGAIFVTHEHSDHISGLEILAKKYKIPIHATADSGSRIMKGQYAAAVCSLHRPIYECNIGELHIQSFSAPHDSQMNVGYKISSPYTSVGIVTDIGGITAEVKKALCGCNNVVIESNHDVYMLKNGCYPYVLKQRIFSQNGHLSNDDCADLALILAENGTQNILLAHLSVENNMPALAYSTTRTRLDGENFNDVYVAVADPNEPVLLVSPDIDFETENQAWRDKFCTRNRIKARIKKVDTEVVEMNI